jgi:hypothetical protein
VRYTELQADDRCERLEAVINLATLFIERQERRAGDVRSDRCQANELSGAVRETGDGSAARPLLELHRE